MFNTPALSTRSMTPWLGYRRNWMDPFDQMDRWMQSIDRYFDDRTGFHVLNVL